jgi:hypothetical protein
MFSRRKKINHVEIDPMWLEQLGKSKGNLDNRIKKHSLTEKHSRQYFLKHSRQYFLKKYLDDNTLNWLGSTQVNI